MNQLRQLEAKWQQAQRLVVFLQPANAFVLAAAVAAERAQRGITDRSMRIK